MKKDTVGTLFALIVGIGGPIVGWKLHKKAKQINEETDRSMSEAYKHIHRSYAEVVDKACQVSSLRILSDDEIDAQVEDLFDVNEEDQT